MRALLTITAVLEIATGLGLLGAPSALSSPLLGAPLEGPVAQGVARIAGVALLALGTACWVARQDAGGRASRATVAGMLVYNLGVVGVLVYAALGEGLRGWGTWPAVALHAGLGAWCAACLRSPGLSSSE